MNSIVPSCCAALALGTFCCGSVNAEIIFGITGNVSLLPNEAGTNLIKFDSASPGSVTPVGALTGIASGQFLSAIHFRPSTGQLYAVSANNTAGTLYTVNINTAALTTVGTFAFPAQNGGSHFSMAFNPTNDELRVVSWNGTIGSATEGFTQSIRINPNTGAFVVADPQPQYAAGDPNASTGEPAQLAALAYTNNFAGATSTTMYTWDYNHDVLARIGGAPHNPSSSTMNTISSYGTVGGPFLTFDPTIGFDISGASGTAYVTFNTDASNGTDYVFRSVNLTTGAFTNVGSFPGGVSVYDIAVQPIPEPSTLAMLSVAGFGLVARRLRRRVGFTVKD